MTTATAKMDRMNLRVHRARALAAAVIQELEHNDLSNTRDVRRAVHDTVLRVFHDHGVEVLTDFDREQFGLPPRGPDGWTVDEIFALEKRRLEMMTRPVVGTIEPIEEKSDAS